MKTGPPRSGLPCDTLTSSLMTTSRYISPVTRLVAFDIYRHADVVPPHSGTITEVRPRQLVARSMPVDFTLIVNANAQTDDVVALRRPVMSCHVIDSGVASAQSHLALEYLLTFARCSAV